MDACYLALHICYHTNSFEEAVFKAVNWGGDSVKYLYYVVNFGYNDYIKLVTPPLPQSVYFFGMLN